jgi:hypothetical protein
MREIKTRITVKEQMKVKSDGWSENQFTAGREKVLQFVTRFSRIRQLVLLRPTEGSVKGETLGRSEAVA